MAFHNYALAIMLLATIPFEGTRGSHHNQQLRSLHLSLFQHETINKTGYILVNGLQGGPGITQTTTPFGTFYVCRYPLTLTANRSSKVVGINEGTSITTSFDGLESISITKVTLHLKDYKGSISTLGGTHNIKPLDHPVVGGTKDFLFVQGYVTSSPVDIRGPNIFAYEHEFHLYWTPHATQHKPLNGT